MRINPPTLANTHTRVLILAILLATALTPAIIQSAQVSESCNLRVEAPDTVALEESFLVSVIAENIPSPGFMGWEFLLRWTPGVINCTGEEFNFGIWGPRSYLGPWVVEPIDNIAGSYHQSLTGRLPGTPQNGTFWLANLTFTVVTSTIPDETDLTLQKWIVGYKAYCLLDYYAREIPHGYINASLVVSGANIGDVHRTPPNPEYDDEVVVTGTSQGYPEILQAWLHFTQDELWHNVPMDKYGSVLNATIPPQPYETVVQYQIHALDAEGNWFYTEIYEYTVEDNKPPTISVSPEPIHPYPYIPSNQTRAFEPVLMMCNISEPVNASGVTLGKIAYRVDEGEWWESILTYNISNGYWIGVIPGQFGNTTIEFRILGYDLAGNTAIFDGSYTVKDLQVGDINGDDYVNAKDAVTYLEIFMICAIPFIVLMAYLLYEQQKKRQKELEERLKKLEEKQNG